jgi:hypothetical protein
MISLRKDSRRIASPDWQVIVKQLHGTVSWQYVHYAYTGDAKEFRDVKKYEDRGDFLLK